MSTQSLAELEPRRVWRHFADLTQIPRPSKKEERVVQHVRRIAEAHGWTVRADDSGNLAIDVPATPGYEDAPIVSLQGHLDMVCEKNEGVEHDFDTDPIDVEIVDGWVRAQGTTLGADNGLGVAMAIAAAEDPDVVHGPLELLMTLDEETGLNGALALDPSLVRGRILLNLDTEEDDAIYVGCAGSAGTVATIPLERERLEDGWDLVELAVRGLQGGHSGMDIALERGNAIRLTARVVDAVRRAGCAPRVVEWRGGGKRNAIPRECFALLAVPAGERAAFEAAVAKAESEIVAQHGEDEPGLRVEMASGSRRDREILTPSASDRFVDLLLAAPHGVRAMSRQVVGLVETSVNFADAQTSGATARLEWSYRSSVTRALGEMAGTIAGLCRMVGATLEVDPGYPGWAPRPDAPLVRRTVEVWASEAGSPPAVRAVHAGIECGIFVDRVPGLQAVSLGPDIRGAHSPTERASVESTAFIWRILQALLRDLAERPLVAE